MTIYNRSFFLTILLAFISSISLAQKKATTKMGSFKAIEKLNTILRYLEPNLRLNYYLDEMNGPDETLFYLEVLSDPKREFIVQVKKNKKSNKPYLKGRLKNLKLFDNIDIGFLSITGEFTDEMTKRNYEFGIFPPEQPNNGYSENQEELGFYLSLTDTKDQSWYVGEISNKNIPQILKTNIVPKTNSDHFLTDSLFAINGSYVHYGCPAGDVTTELIYLGNHQFHYKISGGMCRPSLEGDGVIDSKRIGRTNDVHCKSMSFDFTNIKDEISEDESIEVNIDESDEMCIKCGTYPFGGYHKVYIDRIIEVAD